MKNNSFTVAVLGAGNIGSAVIERLLEVDNEVLNLNLSKAVSYTHLRAHETR